MSRWKKALAVLSRFLCALKWIHFFSVALPTHARQIEPEPKRSNVAGSERFAVSATEHPDSPSENNMKAKAVCFMNLNSSPPWSCGLYGWLLFREDFDLVKISLEGDKIGESKAGNQARQKRRGYVKKKQSLIALPLLFAIWHVGVVIWFGYLKNIAVLITTGW